MTSRREAAGGRRPAFVLDLDRCIGCWACAVACRMKNDLPDGLWWLRVESIGGAARDTSAGVFPNVEKHYRPVIAECAFTPSDLDRDREPACAAACPTDVIVVGDASDPADAVTSLVAAPDVVPGPPPAGSPLEVWYLAAARGRKQRRSGGG